jgi:hypothetical protein
MFEHHFTPKKSSLEFPSNHPTHFSSLLQNHSPATTINFSARLFRSNIFARNNKSILFMLFAPDQLPGMAAPTFSFVSPIVRSKCAYTQPERIVFLSQQLVIYNRMIKRGCETIRNANKFPIGVLLGAETTLQRTNI